MGMTPERATKALIERLEIENEQLRQKIKRLSGAGRAAPLDVGEWYAIKERYGLTAGQAQMVLVMAKRGEKFTALADFARAMPNAPRSHETMKVQLSGIRRALRSHGIGMQTARGFGYRLIGWPS
jgi:DNA-binding response OmpR family regulator